jgi:hypothetical protein
MLTRRRFLATAACTMAAARLQAQGRSKVRVALTIPMEGTVRTITACRLTRSDELWKLLSDGSDEARLSLHALVVGHGHVLPQRAEGAQKSSPHIMTHTVKTHVLLPREEAHHANTET